MLKPFKFSVVIPTHNRRDLLRRCLGAVLNQDYPDYEVIVVDDGSTDGTGEMVQREFPQVRYIRQESNRGPAAARNRGIEAARGEIVAFTDDDCVVPRDWLARLADGFRRYPDVAGVGGFQDPPEMLIRRNLIARSEHARRLRRWGGRSAQEVMGGAEIPGLGTNNVAYRRDVLLQVGGFDEHFPVAAGEDADLKLRIAQAGYRLLYIPFGVEHYRTYTWKAQWRMSVRRGIGVYYFEAKHGRPPGRWRILLRVGKRLLQFPIRLMQMPPRVAAVITASELADAWGQWQMAGKFRAR